MRPGPTVHRRCPSLPIWVLLVASQLILVGSVWDIAWHGSLGREAFWIPPHIVLYSGVGLTGLVCGAVVMRTMLRWAARAAMHPTLVELWGDSGPAGVYPRRLRRSGVRHCGALRRMVASDVRLRCHGMEPAPSLRDRGGRGHSAWGRSGAYGGDARRQP